MLTEQEKAILIEAKLANPHWFHAMLRAGEIMAERRQKYAGKNHPYYNFVDMAYRLGDSIAKVFKFTLILRRPAFQLRTKISLTSGYWIPGLMLRIMLSLPQAGPWIASKKRTLLITNGGRLTLTQLKWKCCISY